MSRYISKLPSEIRELAERRRKEQNPESKEDNLGNIKSFNWSKTPERSNFWNDIYQSNYSLFYTLYPQRDKLDELIEWMEQAVKSCKEQELLFTEQGFESSASCSGAMGMAYQLTINKAKEIKYGK